MRRQWRRRHSFALIPNSSNGSTNLPHAASALAFDVMSSTRALLARAKDRTTRRTIRQFRAARAKKTRPIQQSFSLSQRYSCVDVVQIYLR